MNRPVTNAFTVDVESWCHASTEDFLSLPPRERRGSVLRGLDVLLTLLQRHERRATFFLLGSVAEAVPEAVERIRGADHEIGSHGYHHRRVDELEPHEFEKDLCRSREVLESLSGTPVTAYRAPMWSLYGARAWAPEVLVRLGFRLDSSLYPVRIIGSPALPRRPYDLKTPSGVLTEIPPLSGRGLFARYPIGGTWALRTFFYSDIARALRRQNSRGHPAVLHFHPWELDPQRPPLRQPPVTLWALTTRLRVLPQRIDRLLAEFPFGPLSESLNGDSRPTLAVEELP